jgi:hypothetical protein
MKCGRLADLSQLEIDNAAIHPNQAVELFAHEVDGGRPAKVPIQFFCSDPICFEIRDTFL